MNEVAIQMTGTQPFMGKEIPVVLGGFGPNARCICDKTAAEIHDMSTRHVRELINRNDNRFTSEVDFIDLKIVVVRNDNNSESAVGLLESLGYTKMEISKAEHIYILSERGYAKLVKIMDTDKAWEVYDRLLDEYFTMREQKRKEFQPRPGKTESQLAAEAKRATAMILNAKNRTAERFQKLWDRANVKPEYQALALGSLFAEDGVNLPRIALQGAKVTYDKGTIAKKLGVYSKASSGKAPHAQAIGAIISELEIDPDEWEYVPYSHNGHDGIDIQYADCVIDKVRAWLAAKNWPDTISAGSKNYPVLYRREGE